jgi:cytochrome P450
MPGVRKIPLRRTVPGLIRDPVRALEQVGRESDGALVRLDLGLTRPYLATHPDQVQHILRRPEVYRREGMIWRPLRRLEGNGIAGEGPAWQASRTVLQPLFTARGMDALLPGMAAAVAETLDLLAGRGPPGQPLDLTATMTSLVHRVLIRVFFSDRISVAEADRLGAAISTAFQSLGARMLLPFLGDRVPLPGDRPFRRAVRTVDELIYPVIRDCRERDRPGHDLVALLAAAGAGAEAAAGAAAGGRLPDQRVRDDVVAMFIAGTETTALALTWLWLLLDSHPAAARRLAGEVAEVVGAGPPAPHHLPRLGYTRMVLLEALRLYPVGWLVPRTVAEPDLLAGVRLRPGATVLLSPYLTHRLPGFWEEPDEFRPERFAAGGSRRHRYAYLPFGAGRHQCLGSHFFLAEGQLAVAGLLSRFHPRLVGERSIRPRATVTLRPRIRPQLLLTAAPSPPILG